MALIWRAGIRVIGIPLHTSNSLDHCVSLGMNHGLTGVPATECLPFMRWIDRCASILHYCNTLSRDEAQYGKLLSRVNRHSRRELCSQMLGGCCSG